MKRCCNKIRSELLNTTVKFTVEILSSTFVWLDLSTEVIRSIKEIHINKTDWRNQSVINKEGV